MKKETYNIFIVKKIIKNALYVDYNFVLFVVKIIIRKRNITEIYKWMSLPQFITHILLTIALHDNFLTNRYLLPIFSCHNFTLF